MFAMPTCKNTFLFTDNHIIMHNYLCSDAKASTLVVRVKYSWLVTGNIILSLFESFTVSTISSSVKVWNNQNIEIWQLFISTFCLRVW
jgi:hypothetical protein